MMVIDDVVAKNKFIKQYNQYGRLSLSIEDDEKNRWFFSRVYRMEKIFVRIN